MKRILFGVAAVLALLMTVPALGQKGMLIEMEGSFLEPLQERDSVLIADQLRYGFHLKKVPEGTEFRLPDLSKGFMDSVEVVSPWLVDTVAVYGKKKEPKSYDIDASVIVTSFDEGVYELLPLAVVRDSGAGRVDTLVFDSQTLDVRTMPVDTTTYVIHDIKGQVKYPLTLAEVLPYILAAWIIAIVGILIWIFTSLSGRKSKESVRTDPPHLVALRKLDALRGNRYWAPEKQKYYYSGITDALREYMAARYGIDAVEMTTAEIFRDLKDSDLTPEQFSKMKTLFETADMVKFAKGVASDEENAAAIPDAVNFVTATYQALLAQEADGEKDDAKTDNAKGGKE